MYKKRITRQYQHLMQYEAIDPPVRQKIKSEVQWEQMCDIWTHTFFCYGTSDGGTFHFSLGVHNYASIVLVKMRSKCELRC